MELRPSELGSYLLGIAPEGGLLGGMSDCVGGGADGRCVYDGLRGEGTLWD